MERICSICLYDNTPVRPMRTWDEQPGPQVKLIPIRYPVCRRDVVVTMYKQAQEKPVVGEFVDYLCGYFKRGLKDEDR